MVKNILIADDDEGVRDIFQFALTNGNYNLVFAKDGDEVLENIANYMPDLIILDINMPKVDGFTIQALLKGNRNFENIPIIVISGDREMQKLFSDVDKTQVIQCFCKPFEVKAIVRKINEVLN